MYFSTIMLGIGLAIIIATALGGLIYWGRHVRKSASLLFKRYVAGSKEVKDVSFKILQRVIEVGNSRHDHVGNVDKVWESRLLTHTHMVPTCLLTINTHPRRQSPFGSRSHALQCVFCWATSASFKRRASSGIS